MSKTKEKQPTPKWFDGEIYNKGSVVRNPFSGEEYELNNIELSIYDFVVGANITLERIYESGIRKPSDKTKQLTKDLYKGLDWFRKHNAKAYMVLLD